MKTILRVLLVLSFLFIALTLYSHGNKTGMFVFIALGLLFEGAFWLHIFPSKKKK
ncbi:hypothetical protein D210916BOD24_02160 [Alteromonas sp. D210916BOD_24]|uniref:hypothetical protein n=1 Tax=Alteromonas sp. D210916BOD_24 TaxID=3157618 RepID=UPI00399D2754